MFSGVREWKQIAFRRRDLLSRNHGIDNMSRWRLIEHAERMHVNFEDTFFFLALLVRLLAQSHDLAKGLDVEADGLRFRIFVANVARELLLFLFQAFDLLDELAQLVLCRCLKRTHGGSLLISTFGDAIGGEQAQQGSVRSNPKGYVCRTA
jgi:hypothetical protein